MRTTAVLLIPLFCTVVSCGGGAATESVKPTNTDVTASSTPALPSDTDIIGKIYDANYSVPDGFFVDERASTAQSYTVHHVMDASVSYELCTDDFSVAESWETADNASRSVNGYYVGSYENDRYFEFIRELSYNDDVGNVEDLTSPGFSRVFKCNNTNRDGVDRTLLNGYAGTLNIRPLDNAAVRDFSEYLWQFTFFPERYKKVLDSYAGNNNHEQVLLLGFASNQGSGRCDLIEVVTWSFSANSSNGEINSRFETVRSFEAEFVAGSPRICN